MPDFISDKRDSLLSGLLKIFSVAGLIAYLPAMTASIHDGLWLVAAIDTLMYAAVVTLALVKGIKAEAKLFVVVAASQIVGASAILAARQQSIGYVWMMVGVVLASMFAKTRSVVITIAAAVIASAGLGWYLVAQGGSFGFTAEAASVAVSSLLVVSAFVAIVVRQLLDGLAKALAESSGLSDRLAAELRESNRVRAILQTKLATEESLLKELQHRVRNNFQTVLGLLGRESGDDGGKATPTARRRIRALAAAEDLYLESSDARADLYALARTVIMAASDGTARYALEGMASDRGAPLGHHAAGTVAILLSDALGGLSSAGFGVTLTVSEDGAGATVRLRPVAERGDRDVGQAEPALRGLIESPLAKAAAPEVAVGPIGGGMAGDGSGIGGVAITVRSC